MIENKHLMSIETAGQRNMSRLAVVRHGEYGYDGRLNENGRLQIRALAGKLGQLFDPERELALILSSTSPRAVESAAIIAEILQSSTETHEVLLSGSGRPEDLPKAYGFVRSMKTRADLVVLVTHLEYAEKLPGFIGRMDLDQPPRWWRVGYGEGVILDFRDRTTNPL